MSVQDRQMAVSQSAQWKRRLWPKWLEHRMVLSAGCCCCCGGGGGGGGGGMEALAVKLSNPEETEDSLYRS